jgi:hypothetical protein
MATLSDTGFPNLANWAKRQKPDGGIADIVNVLSRRLPLLDDVPWVEGNLPTGHRITQALSLPSASWRTLNAGVIATKVDTEQFDETCGILEDESKVDVDLAKLNGDAAVYRASEDDLKKEALGQQFATSVFYESAQTNPTRIHGLAPRYGATSGMTASSYTLAGTNAGTNARSFWLISWEPRKIYGIFPKGSMAGLTVEDKGEQRVLDSNSYAFWAYVTKLQWKMGIAVEDYRYAVRYQWDPDDAAFADDDRGMYLAMQQAANTIHEILPSTRFYMDRTTKAKLDAQLMSNDANLLTYTAQRDDMGNMMAGQLIPTFMGVPIRVTDSLVAETAI